MSFQFASFLLLIENEVVALRERGVTNGLLHTTEHAVFVQSGSEFHLRKSSVRESGTSV